MKQDLLPWLFSVYEKQVVTRSKFHNKSAVFNSLSARILCLSGSRINISFLVITIAELQGLLWSSSRTECLLVKMTELTALSVTWSRRVNSLFNAHIFSTVPFRLSYKNIEEQWMEEWVPFLVQHWPINRREEHLWLKQCIIPDLGKILMDEIVWFNQKWMVWSKISVQWLYWQNWLCA